jgi:hypothetical protein
MEGSTLFSGTSPRSMACSWRLKHALTDYTTLTGHGGTKLSVASPQLTARLAKHGIFPNKTFTLEWPDHLDPELLRHFLRGYFDGDGSWHVRLPHSLATLLRWEIVCFGRGVVLRVDHFA